VQAGRLTRPRHLRTFPPGDGTRPGRFSGEAAPRVTNRLLPENSFGASSSAGARYRRPKSRLFVDPVDGRWISSTRSRAVLVSELNRPGF
jgi:hypothetical protein